MQSFLLPFLLLCFCAQVLAQAPLPEHKMQQLRREARDPRTRDKVEDFQMAAEYWAHSRNLKNIPDMDEALAHVLPEALRLSEQIHNFQSWEQAHEYKSYHDAGAILLARCYTLLYYGDVKAAREGLDLIDTKLRFSMLLSRDRGVTWVRKQMHYNEHFCAMYALMINKKFEAYRFPKERDEFDGDAMYKAMMDMVRLRIQDGGIGPLEHLFKATRSTQLALPSGQRALFLCYGATVPLDWERNSETAWDEMLAGIVRWRKAVEVSVSARIAEAHFYLEYAKHAYEKSDRPPTDKYAAYQQRIAKAQALLSEAPRTCPEWYSTQLDLHRCQGATMEAVAATFQEGMKTFPDYLHMQVSLCRYLDRNKELGGALIAATLKEIAAGAHPENAAYCLRWVVLNGNYEHLIPRLDMKLMSMVIKQGIETYPYSLKLRSDYGLVSLILGQQETAAWCLRGMKDRWDRDTWKDREDIVVRMATAPTYEKQDVKKVSTSSL